MKFSARKKDKTVAAIIHAVAGFEIDVSFERLILFYVMKKIEPFIPKPTICRKCLRYGHVAKIC